MGNELPNPEKQRTLEAATRPPPPSSKADEPASLINELAALSEFSLHLLAARVGEFRVLFRRMLLRAVIAVLAGLAGIAVVVVSALFIMRGLAGAFAELAGSTWAGYLGAGVLGMLLVWSTLLMREFLVSRNRLKESEQEHELRKSRQRARFGRDIEQAAREAA